MLLNPSSKEESSNILATELDENPKAKIPLHLSQKNIDYIHTVVFVDAHPEKVHIKNCNSVKSMQLSTDTFM